ncbi:hypothetical protein [Tumebacillus avium]|nr:hypothetical protein [Tumebacillus avium]
MPKPGTSVDFFRATAIYTLCMTYDYVSFFHNAKKEGKVVISGYYALMVLYSFIFLVLNLVGMVHFADLLYADASVIQFFSGNSFAISNWPVVFRHLYDWVSRAVYSRAHWLLD